MCNLPRIKDFFFSQRENKPSSYGIFIHQNMFVLSSFCFCQQILEEQDFKEEDFGLFQLAGQRCIDEGHIEQLLEIIQNEKNKVSTIFMSTF